ncbi:hypothetical protein PR202_ga02671 [Eleusine coracana subsp. coracana]|uniref:Uncharacterized protein n=1 Tax=Eleusine coracana subsp. coracana TaxID=191504 RepID=A0AAV5BM77_ELECO|nr:hypothetical protein PR202_ga02671 [Eleusine coracana subsp. coracana]
MAANRKFVMIMLVMVLSVAAVGAARPLAGGEWAGEEAASASGGESVNRLLRQRLSGPGHSCATWNPNGGCR